MLTGIQIVGFLLGILMLYITYIYYRKKNFSKTDLVIWSVLWTGVIITSLFHYLLTPIVLAFQVYRFMDLVVILSTLITFIFIFMVYAKIRKNEQKLDRLIRRQALSKVIDNTEKDKTE